MRLLVTGRGSIAQRHVRHWRERVPGGEIGVVSSQGRLDGALEGARVFGSLAQGLAWQPGAVIVASVSARHADELAACWARGLPVLAEKPLVVSAGQLELAARAWREAGSPGHSLVGCNLRYLPSLRKVADVLRGGKLGRVVRAQFEVGQDLRQWRPGRDVGSTYSARSEQGGGVVFDLVHEIDMARWLLGPLEVVAAAGGHLSGLPGSADDVHVALLRTADRAPVTIALDYVSAQLVRRYAMTGEHGTLVWDLAQRRAWIDAHGRSETITSEAADFDVAATYGAQMDDWIAAMREPAHRVACPVADAIDSTALMLAMKAAA